MLTHAVVDAPPGQNDLRMAAEFLGLEGQVVRIDADAVPADQPRTERQEVPLVPAASSTSSVSMPSRSKMMDSSFISAMFSVALRVLDDLGGFRDLDAGGTVDARAHDPVPYRSASRSSVGASLPETIFSDWFQAYAPFVAGVDPLRRIAHREVGSAPQAGFGLRIGTQTSSVTPG